MTESNHCEDLTRHTLGCWTADVWTNPSFHQILGYNTVVIYIFHFTRYHGNEHTTMSTYLTLTDQRQPVFESHDVPQNRLNHYCAPLVMQQSSYSLHLIQIWWRQDLRRLLTVYVLPVVSAKLSGKQKHLSLLGRHKEFRLTVRYAHPLLKLGWPECSLLTAAHTVRNDARGHRDRLSEERTPISQSLRISPKLLQFE